MGIFSNKKLMMTALCLFALYTTWGMVYLSIKFALESFPPVMLSGFRYLSAGSVFLFWTFFIKKERALPSGSDMKRMALASFGMIVISGSFLNISEVYVASGTVALILGSTPLWMVIASWLWGYDCCPSKTVFAGLAGGFAGVAILAVSSGTGSGSLFGIFAIFCSMFGWVAGSLYSKEHPVSLSMLKSLGFQMVMGGLFMIILSKFVGEWEGFSFWAVSLKSFLSFLHLVVFGSLIGYTCYIWLLFNTPTRVAVSYAYAEPVVAVILGGLFAGEHIRGATFAACALIIVSVFFVMRGRANK